MKTVNDILDILLKEGIDRALENLMKNNNYYKMLERELDNLKYSLIVPSNDSENCNESLNNYIFKFNELETYKREAIYRQAILDTIELLALFKKWI